MSLAATQSLVGLARQRRRLLEALGAVAERQAELLDASDTTALLQLLSAKQKLIGALGVVERSLDPFRSEAPESRTWESNEQRVACAEDLDVGSRLLKSVLASEREHERVITARRDEVAGQLATAKSAHAAASAYQPHTRRTGVLSMTSDSLSTAPLDLTAGA
ncbi:MAG: hypothetical protein ACRCT8_14040 [Lacipirellulaceae bacterium]